MGLRFTLKANSIPVTIVGEDGAEKNYTLREMSAEKRDGYVDRLMGRMHRDSDGKPTNVRDQKGLQTDLVSNCLFDESNNPVSVETLNRWPGTTLGELFNEAQKLNKLISLDEKKEEPPKNA